MQPFEIGLTFTGTVSAGSYTGGVIDFLIEALEEWEKQKESNRQKFGADYSKWDTPWHDVLITGLSGASGGGVSCGLILNSIGRNFTPVRQPTANGTTTGNDFYDAWVNMLGIDELLNTDDITGNDVKSLLDGKAIPNIADALMKPERYQNNYNRNYLAQNLAAFITLTNLRGIPYELNFQGPAAKTIIYNRHTDYAKFIKSKINPKGTNDYVFLPNDNTDSAFPFGYAQLKAACLCTCAFPGGFKAQPYTQNAEIYRNRIYNKSLAIPSGYLYQFLSADGGTLNTQPFELLHQYTLQNNDTNKNPRPADEVVRTIIMVAPLETGDTFNPNFNMDDGLISVLPEVIGAMRQEAMFDSQEINLAFDQNVYSRFIIAPVRNSSATSDGRVLPGITGSILGTFGAFLSRDFREHDYFLGRRNAQQFLKNYFALPITAIQDNPIFGPIYNGFDIQKFVVIADGKPSMPFIPLCGTASNNLYFPIWPTGKGYDLDKIQNEITGRVNKLFNQFTSEIKLNWIERFIGGIIGSKIKKAGVDKIMEIIKANLQNSKL